jgi:ubiquinol-cytochrome c reductase cytochrome b subunit
MKALLDWLDQRTGCRQFVHHALYESVPGGARWRYVWGSTLTFALVVQFVTGFFLWMAYSPSSQTAWESVYYIQDEMWGGWLLRGIHHYMAHAMIVLLVLHFMQVVIDGAYKAPREINFWFGLGLLALTLGLGLTGYLLPWDQKGYWATKVATNIVAITPWIGPAFQKIIIGGTDYGHHTLTRFFALHAGVLPGLMVLLLIVHIYLFRRHGLTVKEPKRKRDTTFWPDQVLMDVIACLAVLVAVLILSRRTHGAELAAPADPSEPFSAARPEWYFMFLFQWLKYFPGGTEVWGAIIVPMLIGLLICAMPFLGRWLVNRWRVGHWLNVAFLWVLILGVAQLTRLSLLEDQHNPEYLAGRESARRAAERVQELARSPSGIPAEGAVALLRNDPLTQGPKLFAKNCSSCHRFGAGDGLGGVPKDPQSASDLKGFASHAWLSGMLDPERVATTNYFGATRFVNGKMVRFVKKDVSGFSPEQKAKLTKLVSALSAQAQLKAQRQEEERDTAAIAEGVELLSSEEMRCTECHSFRKRDEDASAPDLTGYGSREWLVSFISNPKHERFYGKRDDRMPAFHDDKILDAHAIGLIADWLRGEWYEPAANPPTQEVAVGH